MFSILSLFLYILNYLWLHSGSTAVELEEGLLGSGEAKGDNEREEAGGEATAEHMQALSSFGRFSFTNIPFLLERSAREASHTDLQLLRPSKEGFQYSAAATHTATIATAAASSVSISEPPPQPPQPQQPVAVRPNKPTTTTEQSSPSKRPTNTTAAAAASRQQQQQQQRQPKPKPPQASAELPPSRPQSQTVSQIVESFTMIVNDPDRSDPAS